MAERKEIRALTGLRGVAALWVVAFHYSPLRSQIVDHGYLAVDLFFILSGFVMALTYASVFADGWSMSLYFQFLGRRIARIYPLYLVGTCVACFLLLAGWLTDVPVTTTTVLANLAMIQSWGVASSFDFPCWSLSAEWAAYVLFPLLLIPTLFRGPAIAWISSLISFAVVLSLCVHSYAMGHAALLDYSNPAFALPMVRCLSEFMIGLLVYRLVNTAFGARIVQSRWTAPVACVLTITLVAIPNADLAVVFAFTLLVVALSGGESLPSKLLSSPPAELLGKLSYSIYLTHILLTPLLSPVSRGALSLGIGHPRFYGPVGCVGATLAISFASYEWIEVPGRDLLRRLFEGKAR